MIVVGTLFITSISLYFSSIHVFNKLFEGQAYKYIYKTDNYIDDDSISDSDKFIVKAGRIVNQNNSIINLYGINKKNEYFKLSSSKNDFVVFDEEQVVISKGFSVLYDKKIGDTLIIKIDNNNIELVISDICENGELNNVYMSKSKLANILNISPKVSNTFFSKIEQNINDSSFITIDQQVLAAKYNQNSNKSSAVINQVIGILFSMLMFFLVMILIIQENKENIKILRLLGYKDEAAIRLALGKYRTFISFILIVTMPLSIYISYLVHISISKSTVDYIPFNTNIIVLICLFVMINILYTIIYETFKRKVKVY
ncbi:MAG: hypothetical protein GYA87_07585 [Christensenellaceae bacterium]|nr:hypothetical protein [Christensenellaceae bacterium]